MHKSVSLPTNLGGAPARQQGSDRQRGLSLLSLSSAAIQPAIEQRSPHQIVSGFFVIKASPHAAKEMHVEFQVSESSLKISFSQLSQFSQVHEAQQAQGAQEASAHSFELCTLALEGLVVGWLWGDARAFTVAAELRGELHHEIYCYPTDRSRNEWLRIFEARGVRSAPFSHALGLAKLAPVSENASGAGSGSGMVSSC
jgi:hypothetical protein